jgi:hypothetical protein
MKPGGQAHRHGLCSDPSAKRSMRLMNRTEPSRPTKNETSLAQSRRNSLYFGSRSDFHECHRLCRVQSQYLRAETLADRALAATGVWLKMAASSFSCAFVHESNANFVDDDLGRRCNFQQGRARRRLAKTAEAARTVPRPYPCQPVRSIRPPPPPIQRPSRSG